MTRLLTGDSNFAADMLAGFTAANHRYVRGIDGGVIRSVRIPDGQVSLVIGGGSGHYPAFAGFVGPGLAAGAACGNVFSSPSASQIYRVAKATSRGGGVLLAFGNYAGDVLHFGQAQAKLRAEGIDARTLAVTDDIASAPKDQKHQRRGIAGDLTVFKTAGAAAEAGFDLDAVEEIAHRANERTRSFGVAFSGCSHPGATEPLFTVPEGRMAIGLGIHGEPGIGETAVPTSPELAELLVARLLDEKPAGAGKRLSVVLNGLGTFKYEELFVLYGHISDLLQAQGLTVVEPECGELVTSLDMAGVSLTFFWLDDDLEQLWCAYADSPAFRKSEASREQRDDLAEDSPVLAREMAGAEAHKSAAPATAGILAVVAGALAEAESELGRLDAVAGDGDHGIGMARGSAGAAAAADSAVCEGRGVGEVLVTAGEAWAESAGGTSGALWGAAIEAAGRVLGSSSELDRHTAVAAVNAALEAMTTLGKARPGDKTMIDALVPFAVTLETRIGEGQPLHHAWTAATTAAEEAAQATAALRPALGRARPLAEKSLGHADAGAVSLALVAGTIGKNLTEETIDA